MDTENHKNILIEIKDLNCCERLKTGGEGDDRGWDGWMASATQWTWLWVNSGSWWWTGRPGVLRFMRSQRVRHNWATELNWTELKDLNKWRDTPHSWIGRLNTVKMVISTNSTKFLLNPRCRRYLQKFMIIELMWKHKGPEHSNILKKWSWRTYTSWQYKSTVIMTMWNWHKDKNRDQWSRLRFFGQSDSCPDGWERAMWKE